MRPSLTKRLTRQFVVSTIVIALLVSFLSYQVFIIFDKKAFEMSIDRSENVIRRVIAEELRFYDIQALNESLAVFQEMTSFKRIDVVDSFDFIRGAAGDELPELAPDRVETIFLDKTVPYGHVRIWLGDQTQDYTGPVLYYVGISTSLFLIIFLGVSLVFSRLVHKNVTMPLRALQSKVSKPHQQNIRSHEPYGEEFLETSAIANSFQRTLEAWHSMDVQRSEALTSEKVQRETLLAVLNGARLTVFSSEQKDINSMIQRGAKIPIELLNLIEECRFDRTMIELNAKDHKISWFNASTPANVSSDASVLELGNADIGHWVLRWIHTDSDGTALLVEDATEAHRLQQAVSFQQRMLSIGVLTSGIAHDFNNVLAIIEASVNFVQLNTDTKSQEDLNRILNAVERAKGLVRHLNNVARRKTADLRVLEQVTIIKGLEKILPPSLGSGIQLHIDIRNKHEVLCEPDQFEPALMGLIVNAKDSIDGEGKITLRVTSATADDLLECGLSRQDMVAFHVIDDGPGVPAELKESIFTPFFTTKERDRGTGLGLASTYGFANRARGGVYLKNPGQSGAHFVMLLPQASNAHTKEVSSNVKTALTHKGIRVLIIDDEQVLLRAISRGLRLLGINVTDMGPAEAMEHCADSNGCEYDLVLSDVYMGGVTPDEVSHSVRQYLPSAHLVFMSGNREALDRIVEQGLADGIMEKPFSIMYLSNYIQSAVRGQENIVNFRPHSSG